MELPIYDITSVEGGMQVGKLRGRDMHIKHVNMRVFMIETSFSPYTGTIIYESIEERNQYIAAIRGKGGYYAIGNLYEVIEYILNLGLYKDDEKMQQRFRSRVVVFFNQ